MNKIDEQVEWWIAQGIPAYEAHQALYGYAPCVMTWDRLRARMIWDFAQGEDDEAYIEKCESELSGHVASWREARDERKMVLAARAAV